MRERVAELLHRAGALGAMMRLRRFAPGSVVPVVTYHHIAEHDANYAYDPDTADATPAQFRRHLETLARHATPIGIEELIQAMEGKPLPKNPVLITFDDGYLSCHDVALPILREVGVRATFFIATSYVTERRLYWWERVSLLLNNAKRRGKIRYPRELEIDADHDDARKELNDAIKNTPDLDVERFLCEVAAALDVEWNLAIEADYANGLIMTWDHIKALARAGMGIESHSRTHRVLQTLDEDMLRHELCGSRMDLEQQIGQPVRAIAYPVGRRIPRAGKIRNALATAGYRIGFSNMSGVNRFWPTSLRALHPLDPYDFRRLATDRGMSDAMYFTQVALPGLAYINHHNRE